MKPTGTTIRLPSQSVSVAVVATSLLHLLGGCAIEENLKPPVRPGEPISVQMLNAEPQLRQMPFRLLVSFETPSDLIFLSGAEGSHLDTQAAHTGNASLALTAGHRGFALKLSSVLGDAPFPGSWTLAGGYFYARQATRVTVSYESDRQTLLTRTVQLAGHRWEPVLLDVTPLADPNGPRPTRAGGVLRFTPEPGAAGLWCDDLLLIDNGASLLPEAIVPAGEPWSVRRSGFQVIVERPGAFRKTFPTADADPVDGWTVIDASELRVCLSAHNGARLRAIYGDGREFVDGKVVPPAGASKAEAAALQAQQQSPAELQVPEDLGRIQRNAPGDRDNDGYAEQNGAYQLVAFGPRLEVKLLPRTPVLLKPVLEITGLPLGNVLVNFEGQLVESVARLPDGRVLIEIPARIERPTTTNIRVQ